MNLLINSVFRNKFSETFIRNHINYLPFKTFYVFGSYLPVYYAESTITSNPLIKILPFTNKILRGHSRKAILQFIRIHKIDAVLSEYGPCGAEMVEVCKRAGIPLFVFFHGYDAYRHSVISRYKRKYQDLFAYSSIIFVASNHMVKALYALGAPMEKIIHTACGVDINLFKPSERKRKLQFLFIGRLVPNKNPLKVIEAFSIAARVNKDIRLRVIGDGVLKNSCEALVRKLEITDKVELIDPLPDVEIAKVMQESLALVLPSSTMKNGEMEGTPVTILEAGASGLLVITSNHGGIPDVIEESKNGYLLDENASPEKIATLMIKVSESSGSIYELGKYARLKIIEEFSLTNHINTLATAIKNSIK